MSSYEAGDGELVDPVKPPLSQKVVRRLGSALATEGGSPPPTALNLADGMSPETDMLYQNCPVNTYS
jgi:hypothetical protein